MQNCTRCTERNFLEELVNYRKSVVSLHNNFVLYKIIVFTSYIIQNFRRPQRAIFVRTLYVMYRIYMV